ncbi:ABC transporter permease [Pengzhenrongella sicca]|uniref:ABC transporter permease n=1 Tax=Pengzhenrongella sicca TaxID=2819238 RepID=A0A8A4ZEF9_9MICO|nr:ABC transporter permease [Pengzhenrongella sicca]QTE28877.1 ABC transporter permease [Pengzhenrongella sicca]
MARPRLRFSRRTRDRFGLRDLVSEAAYGVGSRPGRLVLTIVGTVLGVGSLVVTVGLAQTAAGQIGRQFDAVAATQAMVEPATAQTQGGERAIGRLPWDVEDRLGRIAGVEAVGAVAAVDIDGAAITAVPVNDPSAPTLASPQVLATTPGLLAAVRGTIATGRYFDAGHDERADRVVVLGSRAAGRLGVNRVDRQPSIFIGERPYTVIGILDSVERRTDLLDAVILPVGTARADFGLAALDQAHLTIAVGAGPVVGTQAPIALDPNAPENLDVQVPAVASAVRASVQADINAIFLALGAVALLVGGLGIANVTLLSVRERTAEIGLRRALGASQADIGRQFLVESVVIGLLGGLIGAATGVLTVVLVSLAQEWTPLLDPLVVVGAALLGGVIGLAAGTYPALKAAAIEPIAALRAGG